LIPKVRWVNIKKGIKEGTHLNVTSLVLLGGLVSKELKGGRRENEGELRTSWSWRGTSHLEPYWAS